MMFHLASLLGKTGLNYVPRNINTIQTSYRPQFNRRAFATKSNSARVVDAAKSSIQLKKQAEVQSVKTLAETKRRMKAKIKKLRPEDIEIIHISPEKWKKFIEEMKNNLPDGCG